MRSPDGKTGASTRHHAVAPGADGWDAPELWERGGDALNGSYISSHYSVEDQSPLVQQFVRITNSSTATCRRTPMPHWGYDSMRFLAEAIQRAGTTDSPKLRDALAQTKNFPGVTGLITMNGEPRCHQAAAVVLKLQDGTVPLSRDDSTRHQQLQPHHRRHRQRKRDRRPIPQGLERASPLTGC